MKKSLRSETVVLANTVMEELRIDEPKLVIELSTDQEVLHDALAIRGFPIEQGEDRYDSTEGFNRSCTSTWDFGIFSIRFNYFRGINYRNWNKVAFSLFF